ncbi:MAG: tRNA 5-methoxyuridine(34)/uridine 5-oxyacetic acid(34) synthase CmoB [Campylobacterales bacterium]|nr:tRNA 5-methoxyuridine(34)/uridine 5-oxyacetic acid(34) synthase CmoB [Campylobacterales bacterium]
MNLEQIRQERQKWMEWKNIAPLRAMIDALPELTCNVALGDTIALTCNDQIDHAMIETLARSMMPWRKGPFELFGLFIDTEWRSFMKYNLLRPHFDLRGKRVADVGCNNGYYLFRMLEEAPAALVGFDPSALFKCQFDFINHFIKSPIRYELLGVEHLAFYEEKFDVIFCLGVLYHRSDPIAMLKSLYKGLEKGGVAYIDTFMIDGEAEVALSPRDTYSKIPNVYFVPTIAALRNWCLRAGFEGFEVLETSVTCNEEQRKTEWIEGQSLEDFLDPNDPTKTVEGYDAPKRVYARITKER